MVKIYDNPSPFNSCFGPNNAESRNIGNVGDSILIILPSVDTANANNHWGTLGDYYRPLIICETSIIPIVNGNITGLITGSALQIPTIISSIPIAQFVTNYVATSTSNDCDIFLGITTVNAASFKVLPNPTTDFISINLDNVAQIAKTSLYSISGKVLFEAASYVDQVPLNEYANEIYFLQLELKNGEQLSQKIVKH